MFYKRPFGHGVRKLAPAKGRRGKLASVVPRTSVIVARVEGRDAGRVCRTPSAQAPAHSARGDGLRGDCVASTRVHSLAGGRGLGQRPLAE